MLKAIIFDFDGVIVNTEDKKFNNLQKIMQRYGYDLPSHVFEECVGQKTSYFVRRYFPNIDEVTLNKIIDERRTCFLNNIDKIKLISGAKPLIKYLHQNYRLAIATGSSIKVVKPILKFNSLDNYFNLIVANEDVTTSKPDPECYLYALKKLNLTSKEAIIIEDAEAGVLAGKKAGCRVFAIKNHYNQQKLNSADRIFNNHKEILDYFKKNNNL